MFCAFGMRMVHTNKNRPSVADDFRQSRYSVKKEVNKKSKYVRQRLFL